MVAPPELQGHASQRSPSAWDQLGSCGTLPTLRGTGGGVSQVSASSSAMTNTCWQTSNAAQMREGGQSGELGVCMGTGQTSRVLREPNMPCKSWAGPNRVGRRVA